MNTQLDSTVRSHPDPRGNEQTSYLAKQSAAKALLEQKYIEVLEKRVAQLQAAIDQQSAKDGQAKEGDKGGDQKDKEVSWPRLRYTQAVPHSDADPAGIPGR